MKLSQVMKTLLVTALVAGGAALAVQPSPALAAKKKTNVLLFLTDDTGMDQLELYGVPIRLTHTPTICWVLPIT